MAVDPMTTPAPGMAETPLRRPPSDVVEPPRELWFRPKLTIRPALRELWEARGLVFTLAERDIRARYKQTFFGFAWAVITPLMLMLVFSVFLTKAASIPHPGAPYVLFTYVALIPWTFFTAVVQGGGQSLLTNMSIVNRIYCPREVFPLGTVIVATVDALISTVVLVVLFAITGFAPKLETVYAIAPLAVLVVFSLGVAMVMSVLLVYLRDLRHALPLILQFGLFATPIAYGIDFVAKTKAVLYLYSALNPVAPVIDAIRRTTLLGQAPDWATLGIGAASSLIVFVGAYAVFKRLETGIADFA